MSKYEGSPADVRKDKREAKKRGMTMEQWERSDADKRMDSAAERKKPRRFSRGVMTKWKPPKVAKEYVS